MSWNYCCILELQILGQGFCNISVNYMQKYYYALGPSTGKIPTCLLHCVWSTVCDGGMGWLQMETCRIQDKRTVSRQTLWCRYWSFYLSNLTFIPHLDQVHCIATVASLINAFKKFGSTLTPWFGNLLPGNIFTD